MSQLKQRFFNCGIPLVIFLVAVIGGCSDDDPTQPNGTILPTFTSIWPAGVGNYWVFDVTFREYEYIPQFFERLEDVPPIPSMEELYANLQTGATGNIISESSGDYRVEFTGKDLSDPEMEAFQVEHSWDNIAGRHPNSPRPLNLYNTWTHSSSRIAVYGDSFLNWVHLDGALNPGYEFEVQLVKELADDIFLSSRIWRYRSFKVMGQNYGNCLESFYVLDLGIDQVPGTQSDPKGYFRSYEYGVIIYAPEIGPVYSMDRDLSFVDANGEWCFEIENESVATLMDRGEPELVNDSHP